MKKVTDTRKSPRADWLCGKNPRAIETQKAVGQMELVRSDQLPARVEYPRGARAEMVYEKMGIKVIGRSEDDDQFLDVELPPGWRKRATEHYMWSELIDDTGKVRATIFYKAAFYDRDAFINIEE